MTFLLISVFLLLPYLVLLLYYRQGWNEIKEYRPPELQELKSPVFVSVIIPARNEEKNIGECIQSILEQTYPNNLFEVIVVDDHSNDTTADIVSSFKKDFIHVLKLQDFVDKGKLNSYKKKAVETGISQAKGNLIVTTDADCIVQPRWLETIVSFYETTGSVFIAAPVVLTGPEVADSYLKKYLKIFQMLDFMVLQEITGASVHKKFHNMCNGANLAYEKRVFHEVRGFEGIDDIASGDDMLLMHKIKRLYPDRIGYLKSQNAIVKTQPAGNFKEFMNQRIRWASKADRYPDPKITGVLVLVYLLNAWILFMVICSFFYLTVFYLLLLVSVIKTLCEMFFLFPAAKFFEKEKVLWWFIPAEPFHIVYTLSAGWLGKFGKYKWKGREVK